MNRKQIGKIQVFAGILLLLITAFLSVYVLMGSNEAFWTYETSTSGNWAHAKQALEQENMTTASVVGEVVGDINTMGLVAKSSFYLFITMLVILVSLSAMLVLQGLANISAK